MLAGQPSFVDATLPYSRLSCFANIPHSSRQHWTPLIFHPFLVQDSSGSHDITGMACHHTTGCCYSQLQYEYTYSGKCAPG